MEPAATLRNVIGECLRSVSVMVMSACIVAPVPQTSHETCFNAEGRTRTATDAFD